MAIPTYDQLFEPTLKALVNLGGSATIEEIEEEVTRILSIPEEETSELLNPEKTSLTILASRLNWARVYLKKYGLIENSTRGVWSLTESFDPQKKLHVSEIVKAVRKMRTPKHKTEKATTANTGDSGEDQNEYDSESTWRDELRQTLIALEPAAFERLSQRLLREIGFVQVDVLGRSGDGGIDGKGIVKIQKILSYHVFFQCKKYRDTVGSGVMRDFRGAMVGRGDRGLFITTGSFTCEAKKEATRDGAPPIDLIDGDALIDLLKELRLGLDVRMEEKVEIKYDWFKGI